MNAWLAAVIALVPPLAVSALLAGRGSVVRRMAGAQLAGTIGLAMMVMMSFAFDLPSSIDLALTLTILTLPASLLVAVFVERWL